MTRDLRRSIEVLWTLFVACLLSLFLADANVAYADSISDELDMSTYLYVVTTDNNDKNDAACEALIGESYFTLDNGLKTRLFNSEVGGGAGTDTNPNFADYAFFRDNLSAYYRSSGEYLWYSRLQGFSYSWAFSAAQKDLQAAIRWWDAYGNQSGGSSGGSILDEDYVYFPVTALAPNPPSHIANLKYTAIPISMYNNILENQYTNGSVLIDIDGQGTYITNYVPQGNGVINQSTYVVNWSNHGSYKNWRLTSYVVQQYQGQNCLYWTSYSSGSGTIYANSSSPSAIYYYNTFNGVVGGGPDDGVGEGGPIPDPDPVNPPDPEPVTPVPDPEPVDPGDNWTNIVNNTYNVTQTDVDLQPVIDAISVVNQSIQQANRNLNTIDDNLKTGFQAIASQFDAWGNWWSETWNNYTSWQGGWWSWLNQTLEGMRIEFAEYANDITVWLSMIYNKIGSSVTIRNPNVGDNEETGDLLDNFFEWLASLIEKLVQLITGDLSGAVRTFGDLKTRFPFSIPWDLYALLVLFSHSPVTPVFDIPFSYVGQNWTVYTQYVHIDLSDFDYIAEAFRWCSLALFSLALAWKTPYMIATLEV